MPYKKALKLCKTGTYSFTLVSALRRKIKCVPKELQIAPAVWTSPSIANAVTLLTNRF
jgi:hypothetical protein